MSKSQENAPVELVYVVTCYQNIVGIYAIQDDAFQIQRDLISKNRPADVLCRPVTYPKLS